MAKVSNYYTTFINNWDYYQNTNLLPVWTIWQMGSQLSWQEFNSSGFYYSGWAPSDFRDQTYITDNFDAWGSFYGNDRAVTLSQYSDLLLLGSTDDIIYVKDDSWTSWGGDDVVWAGSGDDTLVFTDDEYSD